jgi:thiosulfate/3-mercaptopyruvate sulfurtransferase
MSREDVLVTAEWAENNLDTAGVVFVEVDEDTSAYDGGHIPGAVKIDWKTELQDAVRRDFVDREGFEKLLSSKGISNDDRVILYGGNNNWFAAYAYWYFKLYGHDAVQLLDGGRKKWELDGRPLSTDAVTREQTEFKAQEQDSSIRAFRDEVVAAIRQAARPRPPAAGAGAARWPHPVGDQRAVEQGGQRGRHVPLRGGAARAVQGGRDRRGQGHHRLLPHR